MKNKYLYIIITISSIVGFLLSFPFLKIEIENFKIDQYNFEQLEKVKTVFQDRSEDVRTFNSIEEFNWQYNAWIEPIKNCYYISNNNWKYSYIFWFRIESITYKIRYFDRYYAYPEYDLPIKRLYMWFSKFSPPIDRIRANFERVIENPCEK